MRETALNEEMTAHLGYGKHDPAGVGSGVIRNGTRAKTVLTEVTGQVEIDVPRDRAGTFEPQIVRKRQRRLNGVVVDGVTGLLDDVHQVPPSRLVAEHHTTSETSGETGYPFRVINEIRLYSGGFEDLATDGDPVVTDLRLDPVALREIARQAGHQAYELGTREPGPKLADESDDAIAAGMKKVGNTVDAAKTQIRPGP